MSKFNIDFRKFSLLLLPWFKRTSKHGDWLEAMSKGLSNLHADFIAFRDQNLFDLTYNSQIIYLEKLLNDTFDNSVRSIFIDNVAQIDRDFIFQTAEGQSPTYIRRNSEGSPPFYIELNQDYQLQFDFIVKVRSTLTFDQDQMTAIVNTYKLAGKRFKIETY